MRVDAAQEITKQLSGRAVIAPTQDIGCRFQRFLQGKAGERSTGEIRLRIDCHHDARIGIALIARILAHAVGDHALRLGGSGDHGAAGAHAEAVDRTPVAGVMHELVVGGAKTRMTGKAAEARDINL